MNCFKKNTGLQWGNDPNRELKDKDAFLTEGWLNPVAKERIITEKRPMVGHCNRLNGPVSFIFTPPPPLKDSL